MMADASAWTAETIRQVWEMAVPIPGFPGCSHDCDGRVIQKANYGDNSSNGWRIDHILSPATGGSNALSNLRPRHWMGSGPVKTP